MTGLAPWIQGSLAVLLALVGLFYASNNGPSTESHAYEIGLAVFAVGVLYVFSVVKATWDSEDNGKDVG